MTKQMLLELKDFEIFVERLEKFVNDIILDDKEIHPIDEYDLRDRNGNAFLLPLKLEDYFGIWEHVKKCYLRFLNTDAETIDRYGYDYEFFDLYWNCQEAGAACYQEETFCVDFDKEKGIYFKDEERS